MPAEAPLPPPAEAPVPPLRAEAPVPPPAEAPVPPRLESPVPAERPAGYTRMQDHIPHLDNPATAATTRLTPEQAFALQENLQAIGSRTVPAVRDNIQGGRAAADATQGLQGQLNLPRFRFIDQVPGGRAAIDAILWEFPNLKFPH